MKKNKTYPISKNLNFTSAQQKKWMSAANKLEGENKGNLSAYLRMSADYIADNKVKVK